MKFLDFILSIFYPKKCYGCNKIVAINEHSLCEKCQISIDKKIVKHKCLVCGKPSKITQDWCYNCKEIIVHYDNLFPMYFYEDAIKKLIYSFKYNNKKDLKNFFKDCILKNTQAINFLNKKYDMIIPVPLHAKRLKTRGYNQAYLIAEQISEITNDPISTCLSRVKHTKPLFNLNSMERMLEIIDAFDLEDEFKIFVKKKNILLIDDISTTGTTLNECARILKYHGANKVGAFVIAHG